MKSYPSIRVSQEQMNAAAAGIRLARTAYLPRIDALAAGGSRHAGNNVFGLVFPQNVDSVHLGTRFGIEQYRYGTWGSALGALASWGTFRLSAFGEANVAAAEASRTQAEATLKRTQFEIAAAAIDSYLTLAAAQQMVRAAQAGVERAETVVRTTDAQVTAQLRPGADSSPCASGIGGIQDASDPIPAGGSRWRAPPLSQFVGLPPDQILLAASELLQSPPQTTTSAGGFH